MSRDTGERKCGRCYQEMLQGPKVYLCSCTHVFHPWCIFESLDGSKNECIVDDCVSRKIMDAFPKYKMFQWVSVPQIITTPYIIMDSVMRKLLYRPPYDVGRYTRFCHQWNLPLGQIPLQFMHRQLVEMNQQKMKNFYTLLDKSWTLKLDKSKMEEFGITDDMTSFTYSEFRSSFNKDLNDYLVLTMNE